MKRLFLLIAVLALAAAACSSGDAGDTTTSSTAPPETTTSTTLSDTTTTTEAPDDGFPVTISTPAGDVTIDEKPERVVSLSPTSTEVLFAIGAGDQVVAVDSLSNYPEDAPMTDLSAFTPNVEAIADFDPDLVFISFDPGDVVAGLEAIGIPTIVHGTAVSIDDAYAQWEQTGAATGHIAEAAVVVAETQTDLDEIIGGIPEGAEGLTYYYELDDTYFTATSGSFIGQLVGMSGLTNIADEAPDPDGFGFPQLSAEYIIDANPDLILLADTLCCGQSAETVAARDGWSTITAVTGGGVVEMNDDIASRWSPRIVELMDAVADAIETVLAVNA